MSSSQISLSGAVLLLVDFQKAFDAPPWPRRWNSEVDSNAIAVLAAFRRAGLPVIHVRHDSVEEGSTLRAGLAGNAFRRGLEPLAHEVIVSKADEADQCADDALRTL